MFDLTAKRALVTGASGGIGGAIARSLHAQGAIVVLSGTRAEALEALAGELGDNAHVVPADLSSPEGAQTLADAAAAVALFEASSSDSAKMILASGSEVIFVVQDNNAASGTDFDAQIFMVENDSGTIGATQIAIVSLTAADSAAIVVGDFV